MDLPIEFKEKMKALLEPDDYQALLDSFEQESYKGIRINTLKGSSELVVPVLPFNVEPVTWCPTGYSIPRDTRPGKNPAYYAGLYYVQEPTAMTSAEVLAPEPGDWVLDLCAAPGGKTTQLACKLGGKGLLVANELVKNRADILASNVERMGIENIVITSEFPEKLVANFAGRFDKILVDAPCSGEGMFRKDADAADHWSSGRVMQCAARQEKILESVHKLLKPGGILVYSTCTFSPEENEQVVEAFAANYGYAILPATLPGIEDHGRPEWGRTNNGELTKTLRVMPYHVRGEGHFVAKLQKNSGQESAKSPAGKKKRNEKLKPAKTRDLKDFEAFRRERMPNCHFGNLHLYKDMLFSLPEGLEGHRLVGIKVLRSGLHLGNMKKNRFEPSHTLAMTLRAEDYDVCHRFADDDEANAYLKGEVIPGDEKGWVLMLYKGWPLGFGKGSQGMIKNHYPRGLRIRKK